MVIKGAQWRGHKSKIFTFAPAKKNPSPPIAMTKHKTTMMVCFSLYETPMIAIHGIAAAENSFITTTETE